jgi:hypothetical protein
MYEDAAVKEPKMTSKQAMAKETARHNYNLLCDVGTLFALLYIFFPNGNICLLGTFPPYWNFLKSTTHIDRVGSCNNMRYSSN